MKIPRSWRSELKSWGVTALVGVALIIGIKTWQSQHLLPADEELPAPSLQLTALDGTPTTLAALGDKPILLHFWATW
jgi:cytochrome oxidase Cu insertion factor (SCO1/SenC/PrrC family)